MRWRARGRTGRRPSARRSTRGASAGRRDPNTRTSAAAEALPRRGELRRRPPRGRSCPPSRARVRRRRAAVAEDDAGVIFLSFPCQARYGRRAGMRILVVEDEPRILAFLVRGLEAEGFAVDWAGDGSEALERAGSAAYDLVVLDLLLPRVD